MRLPSWKIAWIPVFLFLFFFSNISPRSFVYAATLSNETSALQQELKDIEKQITQYQSELVKIGSQKNTLQNKIASLKKQQSSLLLQIKQASLHVVSITDQLTKTQAQIGQTSTKLDQLKGQLSELIRVLHKADDEPLVLMLLSNQTLSSFFSRQQQYMDVLSQLDRVTQATQQTQKTLSDQEKEFEDQQETAMQYLTIKQIAQQQLTNSLGKQSTLLKETKGQESSYQAQLKDAAAQAANIRSRLYQLLETSKQITFGQAATIAKWVSGQTGVRPAFLLAVLTQESSLGKNVGTCNRKGDPTTKSWRVIMKPERDHKPFLAITAALGRDPDTTPVSCPMRDSKGNQLGWGGAMGPAQFIPSTWVGYQNRVTSLTGNATADPWDIRDAFVAAAIKLKADGAGTEEGEWAAAMRYFSGSTNTAYRFYGDNVVTTAAQYQKDLEQIQ